MNTAINSHLCPVVDVPQLLEFLPICEASKVVPIVYGAAGIGKSEVIRSYRADHYHYMEARLGYRLPENVGPIFFIDNGTAKSSVAQLVQAVRDAREASGKPVKLFCDEITVAPRETMSAALELLLEFAIDNQRLPEDTFLIAAGNTPEHTPAAIYLDVPNRARLASVVFEPTIDDFVAYLNSEFRNYPLADAVANFVSSAQGATMLSRTYQDGIDPPCTRRGITRALRAVQSRANTAAGPREALSIGPVKTMVGAMCGTDFVALLASSIAAATTWAHSGADVLKDVKTAPLPTSQVDANVAFDRVHAHIKQSFQDRKSSGMADAANFHNTAREFEKFAIYLDRAKPELVTVYLANATDDLRNALSGSSDTGARIIRDLGATNHDADAVNMRSSGKRRR